MFVRPAVNRQNASSVDENLCGERLNNGKTQANISSQKQSKITLYMRHTSPANPTATEELNFISSADRGPNLRGQILGVIQS